MAQITMELSAVRGRNTLQGDNATTHDLFATPGGFPAIIVSATRATGFEYPRFARFRVSDVARHGLTKPRWQTCVYRDGVTFARSKEHFHACGAFGDRTGFILRDDASYAVGRHGVWNDSIVPASTNATRRRAS